MSTINVTTFGATGNGTTNDTAAIQNALNSAVSGDTVFFPAGTYQVNTLSIPIGNITLLGVAGGLTAKIRKIIGSTNAAMILGISVNNLSVQWLEFNGQGPSQSWWDPNPYTNTSPAINLQIQSSTGLSIQNCYSHLASNAGFYIQGCPSASLLNCTGDNNAFGTIAIYDFSGTRSSGTTVTGGGANLDYCDGLRVVGSDDVVITNFYSNFARFLSGGPDQFAGIYLEDSLRTTVQFCTFTGNSNRGIDANDVTGRGTTDAIFRFNNSYANVHDGILTGTSGFSLIGNRTWDNPDGGVMVRGINHSINGAASHAVYGSQAYGLKKVGSPTGIAVVNCDVRNNGTAGIDTALSATSGYSQSGLIVTDSNYPGLKERNSMVQGSAF